MSLAPPAVEVASGRRPNILFVFPDQWRGDWVRALAPELPLRTPHLDALVARGTAFRRAWTPSPLCVPARSCLATGRSYGRAPSPDNFHSHPLGTPTFYNRLAQAGYRVASLGKSDLFKPDKSWGKDGRHRIDGVDRFAAIGIAEGRDMAGKHDTFNAIARGCNDPYTDHLDRAGLIPAYQADFQARSPVMPGQLADWEGARIISPPACYAQSKPSPLPAASYSDNFVGQAAIDQLTTFDGTEPWFLMVNFAGPHEPLDVTADMAAGWDSVQFPLPYGRPNPDADLQQDIRRRYASMLETIDFWLGRMVAHLAERGMIENTLVVFASDHGEMLGDRNLWKKQVPWEPSLRVPMVLAGPGIAARGVVDDGPATILDLPATFIARAGAAPMPEDEGTDLSPWLAGEAQYPRKLASSGLGEWRAVTDGRWKLVLGYRTDQPLFDLQAGHFDPDPTAPGQLYDLVADPRETSNLWQAAPGPRKRLLAKLMQSCAAARARGHTKKAQPMTSPTDPESLVDLMTLEEQVAILSGEDFWSLPAIPRLGIGKLRVTDGPNGARGGGGLVGGFTAAAFPVGISIGASWDPALAEEIGAAIADEVKSKGARVSLAPTVNIHRSVTNGRNFECYAEDPALAAALAVGYIRGLQGQGISATIKHFAGNESEIERTTINSEIDERSLREIYLRPFEAAVKEAGTWGVMSSYNKLNGTYAAENSWLLTQVLREDWGYDGLVMSDWFGSRSTAPTVNAGLDLEMPGPTRDRGAKLVAAVEAGEVDRATVRARALNVLRLMARVGVLGREDAPHEERAEDRPTHRALIRRAGAAGTVLLKNDGLLPLAPPRGKVAVIGPNAKVAQIMGGGSAQLNPHYSVSPWDGLAARLGAAALLNAPGCQNHRWEPLIEGGLTVEFFASTDLSGPVVHSEPMPASIAFWIPPVAQGKVDYKAFSARITGHFTARESGPHNFGLHIAGHARLSVDGALVVDAWDGWTKGRTFFEEGNDEIVGSVDLAAGQTVEVTVELRSKPSDNLHFTAFRFGVSRPLGDAEIAEAARIAAEAETALVFVGRSGEWDTEGSDLEGIALPGRQDELVAAVLKANPRTVVVLQTGGPVELPWMAEAPAILQAWYPGQECGNAIADVLFGDVEPGGRLPQSFPKHWADNPTWSQDPEIYPGLAGKVRYEEGLFTGYRHYDRQGITPMFPFGHGLGYTSFEIGGLTALPQADGSVIARLTLRNTGARPGSTVVQDLCRRPRSLGPAPAARAQGVPQAVARPRRRSRGGPAPDPARLRLL